MKILVLTVNPRLPNIDSLYQSMRKHATVDVVKLSSDQQNDLRRIIKKLPIEKYDRIVLDLHFKRIYRQARFIRTLPNLVILECDAYQNYIEQSKWFGKFLSFYKKLNHFRLVCTSARLADRFRMENIDACFLPKGYDHSQLKNLNQTRDIDLGFIGRIKHRVYSKRKNLLLSMEKNCGLKLLRTKPGDSYLRSLNRIKIFISADIGLTEYMHKNFEAMACGCLVVAYRQGIEEEAMGFVDMENIVLYGNEKELVDKITRLKKSPDVIPQIARAGQSLVEKHYGFDSLAQKFYSHLEREIPANQPGWFKRQFTSKLTGNS